MLQVAIAAAYLAAINLFAYVAFWWDKRRAQRGQWPISEDNRLFLASNGGSMGGKRAQQRFLHKTRK